MTTDKQLEILHDHYKETFARLRDAEALRDRLFLWVIGLFALLILEVGYPAAIGRSLGKISVAGGELNLQALPLPALLNATWVLTFAITLRYCQTAILVNRQYPYLHLLEENISPLVRGTHLYESDDAPGFSVLHANVYQREGKIYLSEYPRLLDVAAIAYVIIFPIIIIASSAGLIIWEWRRLSYPVLHRAFDTVIAFVLILFLILYWIYPSVGSRMKAWKEKRRVSQEECASPK